ncbi:MAG: peptide deformylase, partial [Bacteroidota bacterium]
MLDLGAGLFGESCRPFFNQVAAAQWVFVAEQAALVVQHQSLVARPSRAAVKGLDLDGRERIVEGSGLLARAFQHEMDHLDGRVFV